MSSAPTDPRAARMASRLLVAILVGIFLFGMLGFAVAVLDAGDRDRGLAAPSLPTVGAGAQVPGGASEPAAVSPVTPTSTQPPVSSSSDPPGLATSAEPSVAPSVEPSAETSVEPSAETSVEPSADASGAALVRTVVPVVPVVSFWSRRSSMSRRELVRALERGRTASAREIVVDADLREPLAGELDIAIHPDVRSGDARDVERAIRKGALGLLPATAVRPSMRALHLDGRSLFGNDRVRAVSDWPLRVDLELPPGDGWDQERTWVLVAGGDSFTDRGIHDRVVRQGKGVDHPFDGGTARVTGHGCCDPIFGENVVPRYVLTGNRGVVRRLFREAELAIANHEQPVTESAVFHSSGTRFSGRPDLTRIFSRAGIDFLSLANNHIKDSGSEGIADTRRILRQHGLAFGGAGKDLAQARRFTTHSARGTRVVIIPCLGIVRAYWAAPNQSGATPCLDRYLVPDIKAAQRRADVVIVYPHWGVEYTRQPLPSMRRHAARWAKAGADMVLGAHSHVAGAIEDLDGAPALYSLGNLIFDQPWSTDTMESALLEATFHGDRLAELRLRPYLIHDSSQPNLLDAARGEGRRLLQSVRDASSQWLDW